MELKCHQKLGLRVASRLSWISAVKHRYTTATTCSSARGLFTRVCNLLKDTAAVQSAERTAQGPAYGCCDDFGRPPAGCSTLCPCLDSSSETLNVTFRQRTSPSVKLFSGARMLRRMLNRCHQLARSVAASTCSDHVSVHAMYLHTLQPMSGATASSLPRDVLVACSSSAGAIDLKNRFCCVFNVK